MYNRDGLDVRIIAAFGVDGIQDCDMLRKMGETETRCN